MPTAIAFALLAYTMYGVAMALMKFGAESLVKFKAFRTDPYHRLRIAVWGIGAIANLSHGLVLMVALRYGPASVVAPMTAWGLAVLTVLSHFLLRERVGQREIRGITVIIIGTAVLGFSATAVKDVLSFSDIAFVAFMVTIAVGLTGWVGWSYVNGWKGAVIPLSLAGGMTGGVSTLCQRVFMERMDTAAVFSSLVENPYLWVFLIVTNVSFGLLQVAYQFGNAVTVVPLFTASLILTPVVGGILIFAETTSILQVFGILCMLGGMLILTREQAEEATAALQGETI